MFLLKRGVLLGFVGVKRLDVLCRGSLLLVPVLVVPVLVLLFFELLLVVVIEDLIFC